MGSQTLPHERCEQLDVLFEASFVYPSMKAHKPLSHSSYKLGQVLSYGPKRSRLPHDSPGEESVPPNSEAKLETLPFSRCLSERVSNPKDSNFFLGDHVFFVVKTLDLYQHLQRGAKWFLKGFNSPYLRVQIGTPLKVLVSWGRIQTL